MNLENVLERTFVGITPQDTYISNGSESSTNPLYSGKPIIYDLPSVGGQVHLHQNSQGIQGGRLYSYDRSSFQPINAYQGAMLDLYGSNLNIPKY